MVTGIFCLYSFVMPKMEIKIVESLNSTNLVNVSVLQVLYLIIPEVVQ